MSENSFSNLKEFKEYREKMNAIIMEKGNKQTKRFFAMDSRVYDTGALDTRTKEMLGLVASTVLRCDDCISYHVIRCVELGLNGEEFFELMNVALVVGGSIVIPHFRRAVELFLECWKIKEKGEELQL